MEVADVMSSRSNGEKALVLLSNWCPLRTFTNDPITVRERRKRVYTFLELSKSGYCFRNSMLRNK